MYQKMSLRQEYSLVYGKDLFRKEMSQVWLEHVRKMAGYLEAKRVSECGARSLWWACDGEESFGAWKRMLCRSRWCPVCSGAETKHLWNYLRYRMREVTAAMHTGIRFWRWETTLPYEFRELVTMMDGIDRFTAMSVDWFESYLRRRLNIPDSVKLLTTVVPQRRGSKEPYGNGKFDPKHVHCHGVTLCFGWEPEVVSDGSVVRPARVVHFSRRYLEDSGIDVKGFPSRFVEARSSWRRVLESEYGEMQAEDVDVKIRYEEGWDQWNHRSAYMLRSPVKDFSEWADANGEKAVDLEWAREAMSARAGKQRVRYYGALSPKSQSPDSPLMKFIGLRLSNRKQYNREQKRVFCPNGHEMHVVYSVPPDLTVKLIAENEPFIVLLPPWIRVRDSGG